MKYKHFKQALLFKVDSFFAIFKTFKLAFRMLCIIFNDTSMIFNDTSMILLSTFCKKSH